MGVDVRQHARAESISKRAPSTTRTSLHASGINSLQEGGDPCTSKLCRDEAPSHRVALRSAARWPAWGRLLFKELGGHAGDNGQWPDIDVSTERIAQELRAQE